MSEEKNSITPSILFEGYQLMNDKLKLPRICHSKKLGPRPTMIHSNYCKYCPSAFGPDDDESKMIASLPEGEKQKMVFRCAWRPNKLCKGVCEELDYNEDKHAELIRRLNRE